MRQNAAFVRILFRLKLRKNALVSGDDGLNSAEPELNLYLPKMNRNYRLYVWASCKNPSQDQFL